MALALAVSVYYFGPLTVTSRGNTYILLLIYRFSRLAVMFAVTAARLTAEGTANVSIKRYVYCMLPAGDTHTAHSWTTVSTFAQSS